MVNIDVPLHIDGRGRTALVDQERHIRQLLELMLFTDPGERVNRPTFGGGVRRLVFNGNSPELAAALKFNVQSNIQQWLADAIDVRDLIVTSEDATLRVDLQYVCRRTNEPRQAQFHRQL